MNKKITRNTAATAVQLKTLWGQELIGYRRLTELCDKVKKSPYQVYFPLWVIEYCETYYRNCVINLIKIQTSSSKSFWNHSATVLVTFLLWSSRPMSPQWRQDSAEIRVHHRVCVFTRGLWSDLWPQFIPKSYWLSADLSELFSWSCCTTCIINKAGGMFSARTTRVFLI